mmetsp:Transcript_10279/g.7682  ORF Transcript_10279/g.7682 Transcript_10279/m.7682 type:complete len:106 (+) Transcript_10279:297-614(+)
MAYLAGTTFFLGFLVGPMMHVLAEVEPGLLVQALFYTSGAFLSFSLLSVYSKRRSYLFLGGIISTLVQVMIMFRMFRWIFGYQTLTMPYLVLGLFIACLYIIYDT